MQDLIFHYNIAPSFSLSRQVLDRCCTDSAYVDNSDADERKVEHAHIDMRGFYDMEPETIADSLDRGGQREVIHEEHEDHVEIDGVYLSPLDAMELIP